MAIKAISGVNPVNRYNVNIKGSNKTNNNSVPTGVKSAAMLPFFIIPLSIGNSGCLSAQQLRQEAQEPETVVVVVDSTAAENNAVNPNDTYQVVTAPELGKAKPAVQTTQTPQALTTVIVDSSSAKNKTVKPNDTYQVVPSTQSPQTPQKQAPKPVYNGDIQTVYGERFKVSGYSNDDNPANIENCFFNYSKNLGDKTGMMSGKLGVFCTEPREDGRYLLAFKLFGPDGKLGPMQIAYVSSPIGFDINALCGSDYNNKGVVATSKQAFIDYFGQEKVTNAPDFEDCVTYFSDNND